MDITKIINSFNIMHLQFILNETFDKNKFIAAAKKLSNIYKIRIVETKRSTPFATEICYNIHDKIMHFYANHKYYDGKIGSIIGEQLDQLYNNINTVVERKLYIESKIVFKKELALQIYNKKMQKYERPHTKIAEFNEPLSITNVINYINKVEQKNIIMMKANKDENIEANGHNYYTIVIRKDQDFKDAMANPQIITPKQMPLYMPFVVANFYNKFHKPSFVDEIFFPANLISITGLVQLCKGDVYTLYPKTNKGVYPLYKG